MTSVFWFIFFVVCVVCGTVFSLPCLTNKSKQDFNKARNALKSLENYLKSQANSIKYKVQALDKDMTLMEEDFKRRQWIKYNKHCYYIGYDSVRWTDAERKCREIGGYLVKIDDSSENSWIKQQISKSSKRRPFPTSNSNSYTHNCIMMHYSNGLWYDYPCNYVIPYVCESNFCFQ
ncbi:neurocan core protein-like isoform X3 [Mytilus californianus]|uniref:neurocan core protein-like isoform X3 n=1 Tax=Mytilus californianus TaxID=6549 RepID=UPI002246CE13|nr:neurocan core protein-like isoform X3 [Mytilus californianus]